MLWLYWRHLWKFLIRDLKQSCFGGSELVLLNEEHEFLKDKGTKRKFVRIYLFDKINKSFTYIIRASSWDWHQNEPVFETHDWSIIVVVQTFEQVEYMDSITMAVIERLVVKFALLMEEVDPTNFCLEWELRCHPISSWRLPRLNYQSSLRQSQFLCAWNLHHRPLILILVLIYDPFLFL